MTASTIQSAELALRDIAMAYPEAHEDFPWGERAIKIKGKVFVFMYASAESLSLTTKLPASSEMALLLPYVSPTGYGLGKSGWVSAKFGPQDEVPIEMLRAWIDESFRAVAPKKVAALLATPERASPAAPAGETAAGKTGAAKKVAKTGSVAKTAGKAAGPAKAAKAMGPAKKVRKGVGRAKKVAKTGAVAKPGAAKKAAKAVSAAKKAGKTGVAKKAGKAGAGKAGGAAKKAGKAGAVKARLVRA